MSYKIVADSSSNMRSFDGVAFANVPLRIITKEREYVDDEHLDVAQMVADLKAYKGTSGSSCPNVFDWLNAFGDAENVFAVTDIALYKCNMVFAVKQVYITVSLEVSVFCRELCHSFTVYKLVIYLSVLL